MTGVLNKIWRIALLTTDSLTVAFPRRVEKSHGNKRLFVVRMDALGDLILSLDALRGIREFFPDREWTLTLAVDALWADILEGNEYVDRILPVDRSRFLSSVRYRYNLGKLVRRSGFDVALNSVSSRTAMLGDALVRLSAAPVRVGWETSTENISTLGRLLSDQWYTELVPALGPEIMELDRNAHFVRHLGNVGFKASLPRLDLKDSWIVEARRILNEAGVEGRFAVFVPGTGPPPQRRWPTDRWASLADKVTKERQIDPILVGSRGDIPVAEDVSKKSSQAIVNLTGFTRVEHLAAIISLAEVVVGSDTGPVHLAAALGIPAVCILGGAFPGRFFPYSVPGLTSKIVRHGNCVCERWNCWRQREARDTFSCIDDIDVESVFKEILKIINGD